MSNFNEYFKNQGAKIIVDRFFSGADAWNSSKKITNLDFKVLEEEQQPASYYIENGLTATHKVRLDYTINDEPEKLWAEFEVPREVDGAFIIEGAYRVATNKLGNDYDCRIRMSGTGDYIVNFDFDRQYMIEKRVLRIKRNNPELGISERAIDIKYDDIDSLTGDKKELLKLTEYQTKKFQVKLDLDYAPEYITTKLIQECLDFGDDRLKDLIVDKTVESVPSGFMQFMFRSANGRNYLTARHRIRSYFTKYGKLGDKDGQISAITTLAFRFFKGTAEAKGDTGLQVPPGVNAINLESLGSKITIPATVAFNTTFADIIDLADTPINNNTNLQNSLTVSTHVTDDGVLFDVYTKEFQKVTVKYIDYLNSKVCASEYVDYHTNTVKPNGQGEVEVKYRMKRKMVPVEEIDLIDLHPDYRLSETTRRIPFINSTDSVRISINTCGRLSH